ncbi:MAG: hypothetical protein ACTSPV_08445, partial [Candidatus Hodarchaeales archaeon]
PDFPFTSLMDWLTNSLVVVIEQFIQSQVTILKSILIPLVLLTIPMYFILTTAFKFLSMRLYTSKVKGLASFTALISTTFVLIFVEILNDLWDMQTISDVPLRLVEETTVFSNTMAIVQLFESVFFFMGIPLGVYLILRRSPWRGTQPTLNDPQTVE